jgi:hypothetical protein
MHFFAKEEDVIEAMLEEKSSVYGADSRSHYKESSVEGGQNSLKPLPKVLDLVILIDFLNLT